MNIYEFFYSADVATHCKKTGHEFNTLEMAVIIERSGKTVREKHTAWKELIESYPDMPVPKYFCGFDEIKYDEDEEPETIHYHLKTLIEWQEKWLAEFLEQGNGGVFRPYRRLSNGKNAYEFKGFSTFEKAFSSFPDSTEVEYYDEPSAKVIGWSIEKEYIDGIYPESAFVREEFDEDTWDEVSVNKDGEVTKITPRFDWWAYNTFDYDYRFRHNSLEYAFVYIPVPFVKGDLLAYGDTPVVMRTLPNEKPSVYDHDRTQGLSTAYALTDNAVSGNIDEWHIRTYDLKYFDGVLQGNNLFLRFLSDYIKSDKEDIRLLFYAFSKIQERTAESEKTQIKPSTSISYEFKNWEERLQREDRKAMFYERGNTNAND